MTPRQILKQWFSRGKKPTGAQFAEAFDSFWHKTEDRIEITDVNALAQTLNEKADINHTHDAADIQNLPTINVDAAIDSTSANPVQNQVIAAALEQKADINHTHDIADITDLGSLLNQKSDIGHTHQQYATTEAIDGLQQQIDLLGQKEPEKKEVVSVANYTALVAIATADRSTEVIYKTLDDSKLYLWNGSEFVEATNQVIDNNIYVTDIDALLNMSLSQGVYSVIVGERAYSSAQVTAFPADKKIPFIKWVKATLGLGLKESKELVDAVNAGTPLIFSNYGHTLTNSEAEELDALGATYTRGNETTVSASYTLTQTETERLLANKDGWAEEASVQRDGVVVHTWSWHLYSYEGHTHSLADIEDIDDLPSGGASVPNMVNTTYAELVAMIEGSSLVAGQWYRITDFVTKVSSADGSCRSAEHAYDLAVMATSANSIASKAHALMHDGDTYFAKSRLDLWQVWYDYKNDTLKYSWADPVNGKGVVFRLIDEWDNQRNYDFKNLQFRRYLITGESYDKTDEETGDTTTIEPSSDICPLYGKYMGVRPEVVSDEIDEETGDYKRTEAIPHLPEHYSVDAENSLYFYAFSALMGTNVLDNSLGIDLSQLGGSGVLSACAGNQSEPFFDIENVEAMLGGQIGMYSLDDNVFTAEFASMGDMYNLFVRANKFGADCAHNTFLNTTAYNEFGGSCIGNAAAGNFLMNKFANNCNLNTFGNYCDYNLFADNVRYLTLFEHVCYVAVEKDASDSGTYIEHAQILNGTSGSSETDRLVINFATDKKCTQIAGLNSSGELKIWVPADLI